VTRLNDAARAALRDAGISQAAWARAQGFADGRWHGDACGCPDDRCIGFHHHGDECGCLAVLLAELAARPPCPSWCTDHQRGPADYHQSAQRPVQLASDAGSLAAYAWHATRGPLTARHVSVRGTASRAGTSVAVMLRDADVARELAALVDLLAAATPDQHRDLAEQVRRAAGVLDGQCGATIDAGIPFGTERCDREPHPDSHHENEHLEWWDDDHDGGTL